MAPKKDIKRLGTVQPICDCWRAEISGVGKGPSRPTKALAEQDLEVARGAESRARMGAILKQLAQSFGVSAVADGAPESEDVPRAKKVRSSIDEGDANSHVDHHSHALPVPSSFMGDDDADISGHALPATSSSALGHVK